MNKERYLPENYRKVNVKTQPTKVGQVFFLERGNRPAIINAKITMANGFYASGRPKTKTKWHYTYLKNNEWNAFRGGYYGKTLEGKDIMEAEYLGDAE